MGETSATFRLLKEGNWRVTPTAVVDHPDKLVKCCVTLAREFELLALYKDQVGRYYRPRRGLTEIENDAPTQITISEPYIWFDVYLHPLSKEAREKGVLKAEPLVVDEKILFQTRRLAKQDKVTVPEFEGKVAEVYWGTFVRTDTEGTGRSKITFQPNLGLCKIRVSDSFGRSLICDTDYNIKRHGMPFAA